MTEFEIQNKLESWDFANSSIMNKANDDYTENIQQNVTTDEYLRQWMGPKQVPMQVLIPITVIYVLMLLTGVVGNFAICLVIAKDKTMHTATNYYLFSLAISDIVIIVLGLPTELIGFWHQYPYLYGHVFCRMRSFISEAASYASVLTILSFSMERYLAICHPFHVSDRGDFHHTIKVLGVCWFIASLAAIPYLLFTKINYVDFPPGSGNILEESAFCALLSENIYPNGYPIYEVSAILFFLLPIALLLYLYIRMGITLSESLGTKNRSVLGAGSIHGGRDRQNNTHRKQILRMLVAVVIAFFVCWAPFHAQRLGYVYFKHSEHFRFINEYLMYVSGIAYYISSTINPILYNLMSAKYRMAFRKIVCMVSEQDSVENAQTIVLPSSGLNQVRRTTIVQYRKSENCVTSSANSKSNNKVPKRGSVPLVSNRNRLALEDIDDPLSFNEEFCAINENSEHETIKQ